VFDNGYGYALGFLCEHSIEKGIELNDMGIVGRIEFQLGDIPRSSTEPRIIVENF
jgi:hypothetical protein